MSIKPHRKLNSLPFAENKFWKISLGNKMLEHMQVNLKSGMSTKRVSVITFALNICICIAIKVNP